MKRALISVSDKNGIVDFARELNTLGYQVISTGGTYKELKKENINCVEISEVTNFPEIMDGRVKTLNPKIHGGLLCVRDNPSHMKELLENSIDLIDLVVVNLYPFREKLLSENITHEELVENIDIGGPSMLRSAAKNYHYVTVCSDTKDYKRILDEIREHGDTTLKTREYLASKVFTLTASYDALISGYFTSRVEKDIVENQGNLLLSYEKVSDLRYGENPHQSGAFYSEVKAPKNSIVNAEQLNGKELSFNNIQDSNAAIEILSEFTESTVVAVKHMNPCGVGSDKDIAGAWDKAYSADPVSIFGGVIATNCEVNLNVAKKMGELFLEIIVAPSFTEDALNHLKQKKNLRVLELKGIGKDYSLEKKKTDKKVVSVIGGLLVQERDDYCVKKEDLVVVTKRIPSEKEIQDMLFAYRVVKHVKSNAIVLSKDGKTLGIGSGQMNRVGAAKIAMEQCGKNSSPVLASDAFFPMSDTVELANEYGITAIIQPGGSIRDKDSIELCDKYGIAMVFTGIRHFKH